MEIIPVEDNPADARLTEMNRFIEMMNSIKRFWLDMVRLPRRDEIREQKCY
jgi:hypothetical protein